MFTANVPQGNSAKIVEREIADLDNRPLTALLSRYLHIPPNPLPINIAMIYRINGLLFLWF